MGIYEIRQNKLIFVKKTHQIVLEISTFSFFWLFALSLSLASRHAHTTTLGPIFLHFGILQSDDTSFCDSVSSFAFSASLFRCNKTLALVDRGIGIFPNVIRLPIKG